MNPDTHNSDTHENPNGLDGADDLQQAWQTQASQTRISIDSDMLLTVLKGDQQSFLTVVRLSDSFVIGISLLLLPVWIWMGVRTDSPWTWYLTMPVLVWWAGFTLVYRLRNKWKPKEPGEPLLQCVKESLAQVEDDESTGDEATGNELAGDESAGKLPQLKPEKVLENSSCHGRWLIVSAAACLGALLMLVGMGLAVVSSWSFDSGYDQPATRSGKAGDPLATLVTEARKDNNLVGLAAMVMVDGQVVAAAVDGERKLGSGVPLEIGDRWHLGGISKAITATMIARLVESGKMKWSDTLGECFPDAAIHEDWKPVTLKQLLTDTAGAPKSFPREVRPQRPPIGPECTRARLKAVLDVIAEKPFSPPGEKYAYSNVGYTIAGAMAEKVTGTSWQDLVKQEVFEPLNLIGSGFGPPGSPDETLEQPHGHRTIFGGKFAVDDEADNTPIMGPAATVHMTLQDLCVFATEHLRGENGVRKDGRLLSAETWQRLHRPELSYYAYGWIKKDPNAVIPHTLYWHNGSNTMWYALVVFISETNTVVAVSSNDGDWKKAEAAAWKIVIACSREIKVEVEFSKQSPFAAVRWQDSQPEVKLDAQQAGEWYKLASLNGVPTSEIVEVSRQTDGDNYRKRFEEDLVELLTRMGHPPQDRVTLVIQSLTSKESWVREGVPMTAENRRAISTAARSREP